MKDIQLFLIEDDASTRLSFINFFNILGYPLQTFESAEAFLLLKSLPQKSIVITDICMPNMTGIELQTILKKKHPHIPVIMISGECSVKESVIGMKQGAVEFLLKPFDLDDLSKAIVSAEAYLQCLIELESREKIKKESLDKLANREKEVADLMVAGHKNQAMAKQLGISVETVKQYRANVLYKLKLHDLSELIAFYQN
jgi:FixJ family two-component response regulator